MFDDKPAPPMKERFKPKEAPFVWRDLPVETLTRYLDEIRQALPPLNLADINLEEETLLQLHTARSIQGRLLDDDNVDVTGTQMVSAIKMVSDALTKLGSMQATIYTAERYKNMERLMINMLNKLPEEQAKEFIDSYEQMGLDIKVFR